VEIPLKIDLLFWIIPLASGPRNNKTTFKVHIVLGLIPSSL